MLIRPSSWIVKPTASSGQRFQALDRMGSTVEPGLPVFRPETPEAAVRRKAYTILEGNRVQVGAHTFTTPSQCVGEGDSHLDYGGKQWLWDSAAHAMILARTEPDVALAELEAMLAHQVREGPDRGFVPHMNYFHGDGQQVPEWARPHMERFLDSPEGRELVSPDRRGAFLETYWSSPVHSDLTQPPILAMAALELAPESRGPLVARLADYYDYLHERRADSDGLIRIIHPWESGWDNSQRWDEAIGLTPTGKPVERSQIDDRKMRLFCLAKAQDWDLDRILARGDFSAKPVDVNVLYAKNLECMEKLCRDSGDEAGAERFGSRASAVRQAIFQKMWDGDKYVDLFGERRSTVKSAAMFYPMMLAGEERGATLVARHLANPAEFNPPGGFSVPTTSLDHPGVDGDQYWRGNVWGIVNFFTHCAVNRYLSEHPEDRLAQQMSQKLHGSMVELLHRGDFFEYFNPMPREGHPRGHGVPSFGWNGLVVRMTDPPAFLKLEPARG